MKICLDDQSLMKKRSVKICCGQICKELELFHTGAYFCYVKELHVLDNNRGISKKEDKISSRWAINGCLAAIDNGG